MLLFVSFFRHIDLSHAQVRLDAQGGLVVVLSARIDPTKTTEKLDELFQFRQSCHAQVRVESEFSESLRASHGHTYTHSSTAD
jgi:hypothetical protein